MNQNKIKEEILENFDEFSTGKAWEAKHQEWVILHEPKEIRKWLSRALSKVEKETREEILELIKEKEKKHTIDMELYEDSGGGEMCEVCGKQGKELDELCDRNNDWNACLEKIKSLINKNNYD